ncbi:orotate phosphoribosyltransferase [Facilibium subflavum]|uniref:orotate phosphoribosyltransferase n=1 Tax=Facilibium subflavum TaxID=2219058 RepID=UPI000E655CDD|nr:orotate phosphoribosyltransferase [Facilibium subflavum]
MSIQFFNIAIEADALKFGQYTLKSGRISPYFFNAGLFNDGKKLYELASCYAQKIIDEAIEFDVLFGPAYKGIPLAALIASILYQKHGMNVGFCYNRKEAKDHGEGGVLVGSDIDGKRVLIVDDVITAGTAIKQAVDLIGSSNATIAGVVVALDRQEIAPGEKVSAIQALKQRCHFPVYAVTTLQDLIKFMSNSSRFSAENIKQMQAYQQAYGIDFISS